MITKRQGLVVGLLLILFSSLSTFFFVSSRYEVWEKSYIKEFNDVMALNEKYAQLFQDVQPIINIMELINENYVEEVDKKSLIKGALKGIVDSLEDRYSQYLTEKELNNIMLETQGSFGGIGIQVSTDKDGQVVVIAPIEGTPGQRNGIMSGDRILKVDDIELKGLSLDEAVQLMRGEPNTPVSLTILRDDKNIRIDIIREVIKLNTVRSEILENNIGYIRISYFDSNTGKDFAVHLDMLKEKGIEGLILDLRENPGGLLTAAVEVADILLPETLIVYTENKNKVRELEYYSKESNIGIPYVILINGGSASGSEIVAGAVRDNGSGKIVGTRSFGKGSVQTIIPLDEGGLKLTVAKYYTPSGISIQDVGIEPDYVVTLPEGKNIYTIERSEDTQLKKAIKLLGGDLVADY